MKLSILIALALLSLGLTPAERELAEHALAGVNSAIEHNKSGGNEATQADQAAGDSDASAQATDEKGQTAAQRAKAEHDELGRCAAENAENRPIIDQVKKWWGIGGIVYGFGRLAQHILILAAFLVALSIGLSLLALVFPWLGFIPAFFKAIWLRIASRVPAV